MKDEEDVFEDISEENRSKVWEHFLFNRIDSEAKCVFCSGIIKVPNSSTSALHDHLLKKHSITVSKNPNQTKPKHKSDQKIYDSDKTPYEEYSETGDNNDNFEDISDESRQGPFYDMDEILQTVSFYFITNSGGPQRHPLSEFFRP